MKRLAATALWARAESPVIMEVPGLWLPLWSSMLFSIYNSDLFINQSSEKWTATVAESVGCFL